MALYINKTGNIKKAKENPFKLEKDIQKVFEANLPAIMGLELVKSEFTIKAAQIAFIISSNIFNNLLLLHLMHSFRQKKFKIDSSLEIIST